VSDYTVEKIGKEDIEFGSSTFERTSRVTPGSTTTISAINAGDIPLVDSGDAWTSTNMEDAFDEIGKTGVVSVNFPGMAPDGQSDTIFPLFTYLTARTLVRVDFIPQWDFDENQTNYSEWTIKVVDTALALDTKLWNGNGTTNTKNVPIRVWNELAGTMTIAAGKCLYLSIDSTKGGTGTAFIPPGILVVRYTW